MTITEKQSDVQFDDATHTYTVDGVVVPSVTQVLTAAGMVDSRWFNQDARDRGRTVTVAIELHSKGELVTVPGGYEGYVEAWVKFLADTGFVPRHVEKPVFNDIYGYAGTPDVEGHVPGAKRRLIVDVKTGCDAPHYPIQTAGYGMIYARTHDRWCVFLEKNGTYSIRQHTNPHDYDVFIAALKIVHWQREHLK